MIKQLQGIMYYIMIMNKEIMLPLFKPLLRPIIEFGNIVWAPCLRKKYLIESYTENMQMLFQM